MRRAVCGITVVWIGMDSVVATVRGSESKTQLVDRVLAELEAVAPHDITSSGVGDLVDVFLKWLKSSQIKVIRHIPDTISELARIIHNTE